MADLSLIKKLREVTGCGIADCNKALTENADDFEKSVDWLRKKGLASASKKTGRVASEGLVAVFIDGLKASIIEVNSETDFVARNDKFQNFVIKVSKEALQYGDDISKFQADKDEEVKSQIGTIGENINIRRISSLVVNKGLIVSYIHNSVSENMGKIAVLLAFESVVSADKLSEIGKQIAMHIAAAKPDALNIESVDPTKLSREIEVLKEQARATGKPESIIEKMMEGRIRKYYEEVVLLEQAFVMDDKLKIKDLVANFVKQNGDTKISGFKLYILGEGLEKKENNFAQEVASMTS